MRASPGSPLRTPTVLPPRRTSALPNSSAATITAASRRLKRPPSIPRPAVPCAAPPNPRERQAANPPPSVPNPRRAVRRTTQPPSDGKSEFAVPACSHDALAFVYLMRREMGQGRVAPAETVYFGGGYSVALKY